MKGYLTLILILMTIVGIIVWLFIYQTSPPKFKEPVETVCTVVNFSLATRGSDAKIKYIVLGKKFTGYIGKDEGMVIGDRYKLIYEKNNPEKHGVIKTEPVFLEGENKQKTVGLIVKNSTIANDFVRFEYKVNDIKYIRVQDYKAEQFQPKKGEKYLVWYWEDNPQRAVIYLENLLQ